VELPTNEEFEAFLEERVRRNLLPWEHRKGERRMKAQEEVLRAIYRLHLEGYDEAPRWLVKKLSGYRDQTISTTVSRLRRKGAIVRLHSHRSRSYRLRWGKLSEVTGPFLKSRTRREGEEQMVRVTHF